MKQNETVNQYRLHHLPFGVMWIASFAVAWLGLFLASMLWTDGKHNFPALQEFSNWVYVNARWLDGLIMAAGLGALLALTQAWLMRWRYGFVPRFWRLTTFFGALLSGSLFSEIIYNNGYYDASGVWTYPNQILPIFVWFGALTLVQTLALWPVVRQAWLYPLAGLGAFGVAWLMGTIFSNYFGISQTNALFFGTIAQAVFSGALFLWLMRDYRVEAVAKRDEKAKVVVRLGLHPISFIGLWAMAHLSAWVTIIAASTIFSTIRYSGSFYLLNELSFWLGMNPLLKYAMIALCIGGVTTIAQRWLMQQHNGLNPQLWLRLSLPAWTISGYALWQLLGYNYYAYSGYDFFYDVNELWLAAALMGWFALAPLVQSYSLSRDLRGAWLYALAGIVSAIVALLVYLQLEWTYNAITYAVIFGAGVQAILTGAAYVTIVAQNQPKPVQEAEAELVSLDLC